jgi:hypothetical protein
MREHNERRRGMKHSEGNSKPMPYNWNW